MKIKEITAMRIIDSRGIPTIEATVTAENGISGTASVPSGASTGSYEALELRDRGKTFNGQDVTKAIENILNVIAPSLIGKGVFLQKKIDDTIINLNKDKNKKELGANATLAVSLAAARCGANVLSIPLFRYIGGISGNILPCPMMNILNGGKHADNNCDIQEFMIIPCFSEDFFETIRAGCETYYALKSILKEKGYDIKVGDEGGFAPNLKEDKEGIELLIRAIEKAGFKAGKEIKIALDIAANEWKDGENYRLPKKQKKMTREELIDFYKEILDDYPVASIEDPFAEDDFAGFARLTKLYGKKIQIVGDDLFTTNKSRLLNGIAKKSGNAILIKPNQIGTLSETIETVRTAKSNGFSTIISHRSGDTDDDFIADFAVAINAGQIKTGAPARGERVAKYNRLLKIKKYLDDEI